MYCVFLNLFQSIRKLIYVLTMNDTAPAPSALNLSVSEDKSDKDGLTARFAIAVPAGEIDSRFDAEIDKLTETASVSGFRPGKVPRALIVRKHGEQLRQQIQHGLVQQAAAQVLAEREIRTIRPPRVEDFASDEGGLSFSVVVERLPEVGVIDTSKLSFERLELDEVPDETLEREINSLAERYRSVSKLEEPRPAALGDMVLVHARAEKDGVEIPSLSGPLRLVLGRGADTAPDENDKKTAKDFDEALVGASVSDERDIPYTVPVAVAADRPELAGAEVRMKLRLLDILALGEVPSRAELAEKLGLPDENGLRGRVRAQLADAAEQASERILRRSILDNFASAYDFELPPQVLEDEYQSLIHAEQNAHAEQAQAAQTANDNAPAGASAGAGVAEAEGIGEGALPSLPPEPVELPKERLDELHRAAERRLRVGVVLSEIARQNAIQISPEEMQSALVASAQQYGERAQEALEHIKQNPQITESIHGSLLEEKVFQFIVKSAKLKRRSVPLAELESALASTETENNA